MKKSEVEELAEQLNSFIPESSSTLAAQFLVDENVKLTISKKRKTKLGDYRSPSSNHAYHKISVNGDLNSSMFLLVLLHEFAHLKVWKKYKHSVKAHGEEWKHYYKDLYLEYHNCFSNEVQNIIAQHFKNLKATTCNDPYLTRHLMHKDKEEEVLLLNDLDPGEQFEVSGRVFQMIQKRRTRFLCKDLVNKKKYLVAGSAVVTRLNK